MTLLRLRNCESMLAPNYWRVLLLNTADTVGEAWNNFVEKTNFYKM